MTRPAPLQKFLDALRAYLLADGGDYEGRHVPQMVLAAFDAEAAPPAPATIPGPQPAPVALLAEVLTRAGADNPALAPLTTALLALAPQLVWRQRQMQDPTASANFNEGHANTILIGRGGLEEQARFTIGMSLALPGVVYPEHDHPPEELYLILSPGGFRHGPDDWRQIGPGGTFYNTPGIRHAMRADEMPLLAIWIFGNS